MSFSPNSMSFGDARRVYGKIHETPRRIRKSIARFLIYLGKAALARMVDILAAICKIARTKFLDAGDYDYRWQGDTNYYPPSTEWYEAPLTPGQILKITATKKETVRELVAV